MESQPKNDAAKSTSSVDGRSSVGLRQHVFRPHDRPTLHHVSLFVSDLETSKRFYISGLGFSLRGEFRDIVGYRASVKFSFGVESVFLEAGNGRYVELHPVGQGAMSPPGFPLNHLALGVVDVDAAYARALSAGATPFDIPVPGQHWDGAPLDVIMSGDRSEHMRMAFIQGPSGELIELYQASSASSNPDDKTA
ncbi:MAG: VOC family protein [Pseudomonadota bacterium]